MRVEIENDQKITNTKAEKENTSLVEAKERLNFLNSEVQIWLRNAVNSSGWSDNEVAKYSGHPQSTIYRLLNAKTANPSFALVYDICDTLGISLPLSIATEGSVKRIEYLLGIPRQGRENWKTQNNFTNPVHILPELKSLIVGRIMDDCANHRYPKGSLLFILDQQKDLKTIKPNDTVIVSIKNSLSNFHNHIPMTVVKSPNPDEWLLCHLTSNKNKQRLYNINADRLEDISKNTIIKIKGVVKRAII